MDVRQIKDSMLRTNEWKSSAEAFRESRIKNFYKRLGLQTKWNGSVVLQVVPLGERETIDLKGKTKQINELLPSIVHATAGYTVTFNLDGIKKHSPKLTNDYYQIYRNGGMEGYEDLYYEKDSDEKWQAELTQITRIAMKQLHHYMQFAKAFDITPPFVVYLNIIHMEGSYVRVAHIGKQDFAEGEDQVLFPGVVIEDHNANIDEIMRPTFDMLYQSCGKEECNLYDGNGKYTIPYVD